MSTQHFGIIAFLALTACNGSGELEPKAKDADIDASARALKPFASCEAMKAHIVKAATEQVVQSRYGYGMGWAMEDGAVDDMAGAESDAGGASPRDYTTTNVQEAGVDEDDFVKTDGKFIYVAQDDEFLIVKSWPANEADIVARLPLSGEARSMFVEGDKAVVFQHNWGNNSFFRTWSGTTMTFIDMKDRTDPEISRVVDLEGWFQSGRMVDGQVYAVTNSQVIVPDEVWELAWRQDGRLPELDWDATEIEREFASAKARAILGPQIAEMYRNHTIDDLMPRQRIDGGNPTRMHDCTDVYEPPSLAQPAVLNVTNFDLTENRPKIDSTGLLADGWTVYASQDNMYVAQSSWWSWWGWGDLDLQTDIHKFALGDGAPTYEGSGSVDGWIYDQFAMSEYKGDLRVATTSVDWWWGTGNSEEEGGSNVTVLRDMGNHLHPVGQITGIAPGEQIYAVRMMGEVGYVVTFEQVDPLWTIDLSNPRQPEILGELELPGYSAYLHPIDDKHLLAVGMDGDWDGNLNGIAVSVFDVSNLRRPKLKHQYTIPGDDWSYSEALWDHHAFTFHRDTLSIPLYTYAYDHRTGSYDNFSGLLVLDVDTRKGLTEVGRVDHSDLVADSDCRYGDWWSCNPDEYYWYANMRRSIYIEDNLFSISDYGIKVNELDRPDVEIARVLYNPR